MIAQHQIDDIERSDYETRELAIGTAGGSEIDQVVGEKSKMITLVS